MPTDLPGVPSPAERTRRRLAGLGLATAVGSLGLAAGGTAGGLLAISITGNPASAGLPLGCLVLGSAAGAWLISVNTGRYGRGAGLGVGYAVGVAGAVLVVLSAGAGSLAGVLAGSFLTGVANPAVFLARYAAADLAPVRWRGRAMGLVFAAAAVGAIAGPNLLGPSGNLAGVLGLPPLTGLYLVAVPAFAGAAGLVAGLLPGRPRALVPSPARPPRSLGLHRSLGTGAPLRSGPVWSALVLLGAANLAMVGVMTVAPVHLHAHGHGLGLIGILVSLHVIGMFAPAPVVGWLADRFGAGPVARAGAVVLALAGAGGLAVEAAGPAGRLAISGQLVLLGVGWCVAVVGGSAVLAGALSPAARPRGEAAGEVAMGLAAALAAPGASALLATAGFAAVGLAGAGAAMLVLATTWFLQQPFRRGGPRCGGHEPQPGERDELADRHGHTGGE